MKVAVVGAGYVGLVTAACLSEFGFDVICVDKEADKVERLRRGEIPIHEPGLDGLILGNRRAGRLDFSDDLAGAVKGTGVVFIAVGTPSRRGEDAADLAFRRGAAEQIGRALDGLTAV